MGSPDPDVTKNSYWQHTSGAIYRVLLLANAASTNPKYPVVVVYQGSNGHIWARPLSDWHRSMTKVEKHE